MIAHFYCCYIYEINSCYSITAPLNTTSHLDFQTFSFSFCLWISVKGFLSLPTCSWLLLLKHSRHVPCFTVIVLFCEYVYVLLLVGWLFIFLLISFWQNWGTLSFVKNTCCWVWVLCMCRMTLEESLSSHLMAVVLRSWHACLHCVCCTPPFTRASLH